ncbi:MAG: helicase-related protein [Chrysiogenia bacterium]
MQFLDKLPVDGYRDEIMSAIAANPVVILTAETGAGKSTRVPWWLWQAGKKVHVTQPRRIAARALSNYVARACRVPWGREIGYQTGLDGNRSAATSLLYLTDGVQMVREIQGNRDYDVLILDEIHEWNLNQEVLIGLVRKNLDSGFFKLSGKRAVIMSATLKARQISTFLNQAPVITVPGRGFPVDCQRRHPCFLLPDAANLLEAGHNVLLFQPGKQEIDETIRNLKELLDHDNQKAIILPLHAELSITEQSKVFRNYPLPKAVVATDIAQTSLTIDDIDAVIDSGVKKEVRLVSGIEGLYPTEISTSECRQRAGRAGRVKKGLYILCSERGMDDRLDYPEPEIRRLNLESVVLRMCKWGLSPLEFSFFHRPNRSLILKAIQNLKIFGALTQENMVTADGRRMAELPLSLRSARLLLEAEKGGRRVTDRALKIIAIFETRGVVSKEFAGEFYANSPFKSDLLNQLDLWEDQKHNSRLLSAKKAALAREIYGELKKRLGVLPVKGPLTAAEQKHLFRAILSGFCDGVYFKGDGVYWREGEERQIERTSILNQTKPEMVAGLPFDLIINREDQKTGNKEEKYLPLLTFCSELSFLQLAELKPFSYEKRRRILLQDDKLSVSEEIFFGGRLIKTMAVEPDWTRTDEKHAILTLALEWFEKNFEHLPCRAEIERNRAWFIEASAALNEKLPPFELCLRDYLYRQLRRSLKIDDLRFFFQFHPALQRIDLHHLLPHRWLKKLKSARWPKQLQIKDMDIPLEYINGKPYLALDQGQFHRIEAAEVRLPSGEAPGFLLQGESFPDWAAAAKHFNARLKEEIFERKWRHEKKSVQVGDIQDIPFPLAFQGGNGKDNSRFEFYSAPAFEDGKVFLIHFHNLEQAQTYYRSIEKQWAECRTRFSKNAMENIFRGKGWKIK